MSKLGTQREVREFAINTFHLVIPGNFLFGWDILH